MAQEVESGPDLADFPVVDVPGRFINAFGVLTFSRAVRKYVRENPGETVLAFDRISGVPFIRAGDGSHETYLAAMGRGRPSIFSLKHRVLVSEERGAFGGPALRMVIANSRMVAADLKFRYNIPDEKIRVVYTGLPDSFPRSGLTREQARSKLGLDADARVLLFAGHGFERKGLATLVGSLRKMNEPRRWTLLVAGRGDIAKYERMAREFGLGESVHFLGPCDLTDIFPAADLFVLPTRYDPFARVCLESARAGLAVATTRANGFSEWIDARSGFVQERPDDAEELAAILNLALSSDLGGMGHTLKVRTAHLTLRKNAEEILTILGESGRRGV